MSLTSRILFPVDFSAHSDAVAPAVGAMARHTGAELTLLHAAGLTVHEPDVEAAEPYLARLRDSAARRLDEFHAARFTGLAARRLVAGQAPGAAILHLARSWPASLIMMPTRGHGRFRQLLLGSVTAAVLHDAECPVWTAAHSEEAGPVPTAYRSVVCAIDMGPHSVPVLQAAREFAASWGASLHVIHAVPSIDPRFPSAAARRAHKYLVQCAQDDFPKLAAAAGVEVPLELVEQTTTAASAAQACRQHSADLLVIGRGAISGFLGRLRSNAHDLIRFSPCPVLSV